MQFENIMAGERLMMLPTDVSRHPPERDRLLTLFSQMALMEDPVFKEWVLKYAKDQNLFFKDFANAFGKLIELGVDRDDSGFAHLVRKAAKEGKPLDEVSKENGGPGGRVTVKSAGGGCPFMAVASSAKRDSKL